MPTREEIEAVLEESVRPMLRSHNGDVEVVELDGEVLRCRMRGACAGCAAADITNEELIQAEVTRRLPQIKQVVLVTEVSQELLDMAAAILKQRHGRG